MVREPRESREPRYMRYLREHFGYQDRQAGTVPLMTREPVPPWRRVAASLRERIEAGEWPPGAPLPTLATLADEYGVSSTTVRKGISVLRDAGLVESIRGWGTFVSERSVN